MTRAKQADRAPAKPTCAALPAMYAGLVLTVAATVAPYVDHATTNVLAHHLRDGYPTYTQARIDSAVTTWLVILTVVGALGIVSWIWMIWAAKAGKKWAPWAASAIFTLGTSVALTALLVRDTSGDVGLPPVLGWIGMTPCLAGLVAVITLWRQARGTHSGRPVARLQTQCGDNLKRQS